MATHLRWSLVFLVIAGATAAKQTKIAPTEARFGLDDPAHGPFPADRFTVEDGAQNTCQRINLPRDCSVTSDRVASDCLETGILNQLDGFNIRPRLAIPFSGDIDLSSV